MNKNPLNKGILPENAVGIGVEKGIKEEEHDQMLQAARAAAAKDQREA